jgi:hypothetical protein
VILELPADVRVLDQVAVTLLLLIGFSSVTFRRRTLHGCGRQLP